MTYTDLSPEMRAPGSALPGTAADTLLSWCLQTSLSQERVKAEGVRLLGLWGRPRAGCTLARSPASLSVLWKDIICSRLPFGQRL